MALSHATIRSATTRALRVTSQVLWHGALRPAPAVQANRRTMSDKPGVSSVSSVGFRLSRSGRFSGETDPLMEQFNASISYDKRMWRQDSE